jgi:hypothetical protein
LSNFNGFHVRFPAMPEFQKTKGRHMSFLIVLGLFLVILLGLGYAWIFAMPGKSFPGAMGTPSETERQEMARLHAHVEKLAGEIGPRNTSHFEALEATYNYLRKELEALGYKVQEDHFKADSREVHNLWVDLTGAQPEEIVLVGAHYDSCGFTPGADDNASGVAGLLEMARQLRGHRGRAKLRLVIFVNEEPPYFKTDLMGSRVMARACRKRGEKIAGMISLEMLGDFRDQPGSQLYPAGLGVLFPEAGNFIAFIGPASARSWIRRVVGGFRRHAQVPSEGIASPSGIPGMDLSDHWSFTQEGYPALMVTDGGPFRNHRYHQLEDTPETLDYLRMNRVVQGLIQALREM